MSAALDNVGRPINVSMTLEEIKGLITTLAKAAVGEAKPVKTKRNNKELDELQTLFEKYTKDC